MAKTVQTTNTQWGYFGTMKANYDLSDKMTAELFDITAKAIAKKANAKIESAVLYLDSSNGRHMADALSFYGAKSGTTKAGLLKSLDKYISDSKGDIRFTRKEIKKLEGQESMTNKMVAHITKRVCEEIISEDLANELAHEMTQMKEFKNRPDLHDDFMEACAIVESKVRKALGVK